jgi:hypothetical protein
MTAETGKHPTTKASSRGLIDEAVFHDLISARAGPLLGFADYLCQPAGTDDGTGHPVLTRPLLATLLSQATQLEELLDAYGARNNRRWCQLRALTAAHKLFANVAYKLLHIHHVLPSYRLLPIERDFTTDTTQTLAFIAGILLETASRTLDQATRLALPIPLRSTADYPEHLPPGRLPHDRPRRQIDNASEIVTQLATAFLNLAAESELLHRVAHIPVEDYAACFPDPVSEESLRYLKYRFHNLQSLYDTYVAETEIERLDADLPLLRGHASIIFHLLEIATDLAHYYERHVNAQTGDPALRRQPLVTPQALLIHLMNYGIAYASLYLACGQRLCHGMLKRYAQVTQVELPVPRYRGFHVRPATLVAKIVLHYGSEVSMELDGEPYDASSPMDLFRANEQINAWKRRWLAAEITQLRLRDTAQQDIKTAVMRVLLKLAGQGKLVVYEQPLKLSRELERQEGSLLERVTAEIARLQATGKIDINSGLTIRFIGDQRVLADIELLAKYGYGEDTFGNNIPLPKPLAYLRR